MPDKQSKEDKAIITKGEMLRSLVESDGWKVAKEMLDKRIDVVKLVSTIDFKQSIEDVGKEAYARAVAINTIQNWFNDIQAQIDAFYDQTKPEEDDLDEIVIQK